jgi:hypothetical protein
MTERALTLTLAVCAATASWLVVQLGDMNADAQARIDAAREARAALCSTDIECAALCPADEPVCNGGPEPKVGSADYYATCATHDCWE